MARKKIRVTFSPHPAVAYAQKVKANLEPKTGKSFDQWVALAKKQDLHDVKALAAWLKGEHQLGTNTSTWVAETACGIENEYLDEKSYMAAARTYVKRMFDGKKANLKPIHDEIIQMGLRLGKDVRISPCRTIVPLYRNHVFAEIKPATQKRIDLGLALKDCRKRIPKRLVETGGLKKGDRITHKFEITEAESLDDQVVQWMRVAYELDE